MKNSSPRRLPRLLATAAGAVGAIAALLVGSPPPASAAVACSGYSSSTTTCVSSPITVGGTSYAADWYLPNGTATGLMLVEHGFSRSCKHLRGTSKAIAQKGLMVVCLNEDMTAGNPGLATIIGNALADRAVVPPNGKPLPTAYIVGGHSAGGHFAALVGQRLAQRGYAGLKGAVLFDPVAADGFTAALLAVSAGGSRPVLSIAARPSVINLFNNSFGALTSLGADFVGIQLVWSKISLGTPSGGSCHIDSEGENTDFIGVAGALCSPNATQTARLRDFASTWAKDLATGTRTASHYCTDADVVATCGSVVRDLVDRSLPLAAPIR
ncbi:alpha/beta hydrolase [Mumia sp. zg.B21]|uniref:alpha/beta hydrolase fold domain-containing protein n=1 Tax=Mumia sp. zg.B21 TaxID=2855447 RepID=UPI001C6E6F47|nr:alpha/beta hydrolase fold domain-containing protein [Mumia sp. zg.B21]MBW9211319.1 alpha/beta hydrolase [Mumia sp. zg.B21]